MVTESPLLSPAELSAYLKIPLGTIRKWRGNEQGPPGCRVGRHVRYRRCDVEAWLASRLGDEEAASA
jgi:excisionase family DNA binding protein